MEFAHLETRSPGAWREWDRINADVTDVGVVIARKTELTPSTIDFDLEVRDIAVADCRDVYVLDADGGLSILDPESDSPQPLPSLDADGDGLADPQALGVGSGRLYVTAAGRLRAYEIDGFELRWESDTTFADPVALVEMRGEVSVIDRGIDADDARLVRLDEAGEELGVASELRSPIDLAIDRAGNRYVLDVTDDDERIVRTYPTGADAPDGVEDRPLDGTFRAASAIETLSIGQLLVAVEADDERTAIHRLDVHSGSTALVDRFERSSSTIAMGPVSEGDEIVQFSAVDASDRVYRVVGEQRPRRNPWTGEFDAQLVRCLDAGEDGTTWHRMRLDLDRSSRTRQVRLSYRATDTSVGRADDRLRRIEGIGDEYAHRLRQVGVERVSELASQHPRELAARIDVSDTKTSSWIERAHEIVTQPVEWVDLDQPNPTDALLEEADGRYLWLKLELIGNEGTSPRVNGARAYFPRRSYLRYLPAVYREDPASAAFLEEFLSIFESLYTDIEEEIGGVTRFMDAGGVPSEDLAWLGGWLALDLDENWPEDARRELLARAPELYRSRGTREGLIDLLGVYLRQTGQPSAWHEALDTDTESIQQVVRTYADTDHTARRHLGEHDTLRGLSGETAVCDMIVAWSRVRTAWQQVRDAWPAELADGETSETFDALEDEVREAVEPLLESSDEAAIPYLLEYAKVLEGHATGLDELTGSDLPDEVDINARLAAFVQDLASDRARYETMIRESAIKDEPYVIEARDLDCIDSPAVLDAFGSLVGHERAFTVLARPSVVGERFRAVRRIVDAQQPAHSAGGARRLQPWIQLGCEAFLGINSRLSPRELVLDRSSLGKDSVLKHRPTVDTTGGSDPSHSM